MQVQPTQQSVSDEAIRARLQEELSKNVPQPVAIDTSGEPRPGCTNHTADCASDSEFRHNDRALRAVLDRVAEQVRHAIVKLDHGTYGICDDCRGPIEQERLEVCVYAAICCSCIKKANARRH